MHLCTVSLEKRRTVSTLPVNDHVTYGQPMARNSTGNDVKIHQYRHHTENNIIIIITIAFVGYCLPIPIFRASRAYRSGQLNDFRSQFLSAPTHPCLVYHTFPSGILILYLPSILSPVQQGRSQKFALGV